MDDEEWDTGAEASGDSGDPFNKFDPHQSIGGPPTDTTIKKEEPKPTPLGPSSSGPGTGTGTGTGGGFGSAKTGGGNNNNNKGNFKPAAVNKSPPPPPTRQSPPQAPASPALQQAQSQADEVSAPRTFSQRFNQPVNQGAVAFTAQLDDEALAHFNMISKRPFSEQAVAFLNAYWQEVGSQAEFIFSVAYEFIKKADMHAKGINYVHLYDEGNDLDFNIGLYFYEKLCKYVLEDPEGKKWRDDPKYKPSLPVFMTALVRKQELREKVDVNFDGRISFLEYLLYQYRAFANPKEFTQRSMEQTSMGEHPEIVKAKKMLEEVNAAIRAFEKEKQRLKDEEKAGGVKGLGAKHQLSILGASPLAEQLNASLIKAEAAVRIAGRKFGANNSVLTMDPSQRQAKATDGSLWWLSRDLTEKKKRYKFSQQ